MKTYISRRTHKSRRTRKSRRNTKIQKGGEYSPLELEMKAFAPNTTNKIAYTKGLAMIKSLDNTTISLEEQKSFKKLKNNYRITNNEVDEEYRKLLNGKKFLDENAKSIVRSITSP
jgi:hypothetical protein